jgi:ABC-type branched-subunit amino acid transport system substrate-binding protein
MIRRPLSIAVALLGLLGAACGDGHIGGVTGGGDAGAQATTPSDADGNDVAAGDGDAAECPGEPLKFTTIAALTSQLGDGGDRVRIGTEAGVQAVNRECALGRPIEVELCDDTGDVNQNLECGRKAASNGSLALLTLIGAFDDGATASGLPALYTWGTSAFELTDENAYSSISGISVGISGVTAAKAKGADDFLLVLPDVPALQFAATQVEQVADIIGIDVEVIYFPPETTDYAPIAAQIAERDTDAVGLLPVQPVVMLNALAAEGITPEDHIVTTASVVMSPEVVHELGDALDGLIVVSPGLPPTDTDNPGIAEFRDDLAAAGFDPDDPDIDFNTVVTWSNVKKLEEALSHLSPAEIASLDSQGVVDAVVANPVERPETAPYDFRENALPELPDLAAFRIFTREVAILQMHDGQYDVLSDDFVDILEPPDLS